MAVHQRSQREVDDMAKRYLEGGQTLEEIGEHYDISRARVHQILKKAGIDMKKGGAALRAARRAEEAEDQRMAVEAVKAKRFGLSLKEFLRLKEENGNGVYMNDPDSLFYGYMMFKRNQMRHYPEVPFTLTFSEWDELWRKSGVERNKSNWMIRKDRHKPFEKRNMKIVPAGDAIREVRVKEAA